MVKQTIVVAALLMALAAGSLANEPNQKLLALSKLEMHEVFTRHVKQSGENCDAVVRTMLRHNVAGEPAFWNVGCRNRKRYWVTISANSDFSPLVLTCEKNKDSVARLTGQTARAPECWKKS
jgi:hypothetical protein